MNNNNFDDILKNSMETPRSIPFDESAWERMEQQMPQATTPPIWKTWLKFLPIAVGMLGLLTWNICLQQEINYMQAHPNVIVQTETTQPEVIHRIDTIYQITEKRITAEAIKNYLEQYANNNGLSHTNNRFVIPKNSSLLKPNSFITSNSNSRLSGSYNPKVLKNSILNQPLSSNFFKNNSSFSNLNVSNSSETIQTDSIQTLADQTFSNHGLNEKNSLNENVATNNGDINGSNIENDQAIDEETLSKNILNELENQPIQDIYYYQNLNNLDHIDMVDLYRPSKIKPTFRSKLRFEEFSLGLGNTISVNIPNNAFLISYGLHAGAYILPNTSLEVDVNYLNTNSLISRNSVYTNDLPYPSSQQIPANSTLTAVSLGKTSIQMSLGLKRIVFKDEHIRPFGEIGWLPSKELSGSAIYHYLDREGSQNINYVTEQFLLENAKYLNWNLSRVYAGGGFSFSLLNGNLDFDVGIRFTQSLNSLQRSILFSDLYGTSALGSFTSLTYNF